MADSNSGNVRLIQGRTVARIQRKHLLIGLRDSLYCPSMVDRSESIISHYDRPYMPSSYKKKEIQKNPKKRNT